MSTTDWVETSNARLLLRDDGIVELHFEPMAALTLEDAKETVAAMTALVEHTAPAPLLVDVQQLKSQSLEARRFVSQSDEAARAACSVALLIGNPVSRVLGSVYIGLSKPRMPTRLFTDKEAAIGWLKKETP